MKPLGVMVNILGLSIDKTVQIQIVLKQIKQDVFVLLSAVYTHPVKYHGTFIPQRYASQEQVFNTCGAFKRHPYPFKQERRNFELSCKVVY
jgi:hypothetical protein